MSDPDYPWRRDPQLQEDSGTEPEETANLDKSDDGIEALITGESLTSKNDRDQTEDNVANANPGDGDFELVVHDQEENGDDDTEIDKGDESEQRDEDADEKEKETEEKDEKSDDEDDNEHQIPQRGMSYTIKMVYEDPEICKRHTNWLDEPPIEHDAPIEWAPETLRHAILLQYRKAHRGRTDMSLSTVIIRSPILKQILEDLDIDSFPNTEEGLEISAPFYGLVYAYDDLKKIAEEKRETIRWTDALLLRRMLEKELAMSVDYFQAKTWICTKVDGDDTLVWLEEKGEYYSVYGASSFTIKGAFVDWDGIKFGRVKRILATYEYKGEKSITSLLAFPVEYYEHYSEEELEIVKEMLEDDECLLACSLVLPYFHVDSVSDITWDEREFESLRLPGDYKELIFSFVESQVATKGGTFDDIIAGKGSLATLAMYEELANPTQGRGMIMLLTGPVGVGKTLTAEAVAENLKAPLYSISAGQIGTDVHSVEEHLSRFLELATKWNAILLLDEARIFLEKRSADNLERNGLVANFIGIANKSVGKEGDDAHEESGISDKDLEYLASKEMNGRQIKNILKSAQLLASRSGKQLALSHIETVLRVSNEGETW
ncbi:uncharacterized protein PAC_11857 [Phialocephala subalpina]|uniref:AAA+ ATPase domain-containing protein n=1 Tax=Phialocephala subalpina TaxID=576137 RepID=A0A1L7XAA2_9HELO|nr:uncharacterized protein PAC_11857 [Phialocephala subalpina]